MKVTTFYTASVQRSASYGSRYKNISVQFYALPLGYPRDPFATVTAQSSNGNAAWYAFRIESSLDFRGPETRAFERAIRFARAFPISSDLRAWVDGLHARGIRRYVRDEREWTEPMESFVRDGSVRTADWRRWMAVGNDSQNFTYVCARSEAEAKDEIHKWLLNRMSPGEFESTVARYTHTLAAWLAAGKPCTMDEHAVMPLFRPIDREITTVDEETAAERANENRIAA